MRKGQDGKEVRKVVGKEVSKQVRKLGRKDVRKDGTQEGKDVLINGEIHVREERITIQCKERTKDGARLMQKVLVK